MAHGLKKADVRKILKWGGVAAAVPILLVVLLFVALYLPPVQNWAVRRVAEYASRETGMQVTVGRVLLQFPLDLSIDDFRAIQQNDSLPQVRDTIADARRLVVDVRLLPLLDSRVEIDELDFRQMKVNTADFIHEARVKGQVDRLSLQSHGIDLGAETVKIDDALLVDANVSVELSDTVPEDTTKSENRWKIDLRKLTVRRTAATIHMPGDTLQVGAYMDLLTAEDGLFDLGKSAYSMNRLRLSGARIAYDNNFKVRAKGFDTNHIALSGIALGIDSFYYCAPKLVMNIRNCAFREKSGLQLADLSGPFLMDSLRLALPSLSVKTGDSWLKAQFQMDMNAFDDAAPGKFYLTADASLAKRDIRPYMADLPKTFVRQYPDKPLLLKTKMEGNLRRLDIVLLNVTLPTALQLTASGKVSNVTDMDRLRTDISLKARTQNINFIKPLAGGMDGVRLPAMALSGKVRTVGLDNVDADLLLAEGGGTVRAKARANLKRMAYTADVKARNFHVQHFLPTMGARDFSGSLALSGSGTDPMSGSMAANVKADITKFFYDKYDLSGITADARLGKGTVSATVNGDNNMMRGTFSVDGFINSRKVDVTVSADMHRLDLYAMGVTQRPLTASFCCHFDVATDMRQMYMLRGGTSDVTIIDSARVYRPLNVTMDVFTSRDTTRAQVECGDFNLDMAAQGGYENLIACCQKLVGKMSADLEERRIDYVGLRSTLPVANIKLCTGGDNIFGRFMAYNGITFSDLDIDMVATPENGLNGLLSIDQLKYNGVQLDTIRFNIVSDSVNCTYNAQIRNARNNPQYVFNALLDGYIFDRGSGLNVKVYDAEDRLGVKLGASAVLEDNGLRLRLLTDDPILGYKKFKVNDGNYLFLGDDQRVSADLKLVADDGTGLQVYTDDDNTDALQDITVSLNDFDLSKLTTVLPYLPQITGKMNGDFHAIQTAENITVSSTLSVDDMTYEHCAMGNISTELVYMPHDDGSHYVDALLYSEGNPVGSLVGTYYPTGDGVIDATLSLDRFPLNVVNGFIPDQLFGFKGYADGEMKVKGAVSKPQVDGEVYLDSTYLVSVPYGMELRFSDDPVRVVGSKLLMENFEVFAHNDNPLNIVGNIDFSDPADMSMDLRIKAQNYQIINAKENYRSVAYGKAFVDFFGFIRGKMDNLVMRGRLNVLGTTDVAYILRDSPLTTDNQMDELVTFTNLSDSTADVVERPQLSGLDMDLTLSVAQGAHVMCYLNSDHSNYVDLMGGGDLRLQYDPMNELMLTGKYTLSNGEMKYALPVIPLKTFTIENGSYIEFTGDPMNPKLNITATEETKASVGTDGQQSRSVLFKCGVVITKTLSDMGLEFTLDAPEDMSLHNELASMSVEQRGKLAVTMLTTGMYLADGNTSGFSMNSALSSFLQSEINNITGNALRTLDLSFGIDNTTDASGSMHTDYSFKFAKRFWNNRLKIMIGGKVSTGSEASNQNDSFFDNVTFEYRLDDTANKSVKLFYDNNSYDWLEGTTSEFGVGFTWRRTLQHFKDIFSFKKEQTTMPAPPKQPADSLKTINNDNAK